jgi:hypothetical protein
MLTLLVVLAAALFAGVRLLTFVYTKKHDISLAQIDRELIERFTEGAHESEKNRPLQ